MAPIKVIINILFTLCFSTICLAQNFADKDYFLVDSLVLENISAAEKNNLDAALESFHEAKDDTSKLNALSPFIQTSLDDNVWPKYNAWLHHFVKEKLKRKNTKEVNLKLKKYLADTYNDFGQMFQPEGKLMEALNNYNKSLKIHKEIGNKAGMAVVYNNIATLYNGQGNDERSLEYFLKSLTICEELNITNEIPTILNNIGSILNSKGDLAGALEYIERALKVSKDNNNKAVQAYSLNEIGEILCKQNKDKEGLEYYLKSLKIREEIGDKVYLGKSLSNLGEYYFKSNDIEKAEEYGQMNLTLSKELKYPANILMASRFLHQVYVKQEKYEEALEMYILRTQMKDSLNNTAVKKLIIEEQEKNKYTTKIAIQKAEHEKQKEIDYLRNQKESSIIIISFIIIMIVFGFLYFRNRTRLNSESQLLLKEIELLKENALSNVVIPGKTESDLELNKEIIESHINIKLNPTDWSILNILYQNPVISNQELADKISLSIEGVASSLKKMYLNFDLVDTKRSQKKLELIVIASRMSNTPMNG